MPRPKSDLIKTTFRVHSDDLSRLDRIAEHFGYVNDASDRVGEPNRNEALRHAIRDLEKKVVRARKKTGKKSS